MIQEYTIYNPETGKIIRGLKCTPDMLNINIPEGAEYIEGYFPPSIYDVIKDGKAVEKEESTNDIKLRNLTFRLSELKGSDWTQIPDCPLSSDKKTEYQTYRQALRDITTHSNWPNLEDSDWPTKPS